MDPVSQQCGFTGNSDLCGLGIRLGVYLQWLSSQIAVYFHLEGSNDLSNAYFAFSIALMIALFVLTFQGGAHTADIVVMFYIYFGGLLCVRGYRTRGRQPPPTKWRMVLGNFLMEGMAIYGVWFWCHGKSSNLFIATPCGTIVFLLAKIPARHFAVPSFIFALFSIYVLTGVAWIVAPYAYKFVIHHYRQIRIHCSTNDGSESLGLSLQYLDDLSQNYHSSLVILLRHYCGTTPYSALSAQVEEVTLTHLCISTNNGMTQNMVCFDPPLADFSDVPNRLENMRRTASEALYNRSIAAKSTDTSVFGRLLSSGTHFKSSVFQQRANVAVLWAYLRSIPPISLINSVLATELTLKWNQISDVYTVGSAGQLIPFIVGVAGLLKVLYDVRTKYKVREHLTFPPVLLRAHVVGLGTKK